MAGAIFVVGESVAGQQGPVAALLSTVGWADAAQRVLGSSWVVTREGIVAPSVLREVASHPDRRSPSSGSWRGGVPVVAKTLVKDARSWLRGRGFRVDPIGPWSARDVAFVWQRHQLFITAGPRLARALGVPAVVFVHAPIVWQAARWGVRRPGWGAAAERLGEAPALRTADVVACGTEEVAAQVQRLGVEARRVVVTPTGVDPNLFPEHARTSRNGSLVVGWVGSFRAFHALELLVDAVAAAGGASLLFVGDGPERGPVERRCRELGVDATFTGTVPHAELPLHLRAMDVATVVASQAGFHYSPLKLAEYLAAGLPVIAPRVPQLVERLHDEAEVLFVTPGDVGALTRALCRLRDDPALRTRLGEAARAAAPLWSWDQTLRLVMDALARVGPAGRAS